MEVIGKIIQVFPEASGTSQAGNQWKKREYVLETLETYPKKIHFDFFGERADQYPLSLNQVVCLHFNIESREYNGRWYTSIRGLSVSDPNQQQAPYGAPAAPAYGAQAPAYGAPAAPAYGAPAPAYGAPAAPAYQGNNMTPPPAPGFNQAANPTDDLPF